MTPMIDNLAPALAELGAAVQRGLRYMVQLRDRRGDPAWFNDSLLPGLVPPRVIEMMLALFVERELGLCEHCDMDTHCHICVEVRPGTYAKLCTILFHDAIRPRWRLEDVL